MLLASAAVLIWSATAQGGDLSGSATINYTTQKVGSDSFTSSEERLRVNWRTALSNVDLLELYFQMSRQEQNNPDTEELRPLAGLNLVGPEYRWLLEYREFEQSNNEEDGFTQTTDTFFTTFNYHPDPDFPDITLDFSRVTSQDDLDEPQVDYVETDWGIRTRYELGSMAIRYSHREKDIENNLKSMTITNLQGVTGVAADQTGIIYVTDTVSNAVFRFSSSGAFLGSFGSFGSGEGQFLTPLGVDVNPNFVYVVDSGNDRVQRFDSTGTFISEWGSFGVGAGEFNTPYGIAVDGTGVYVTDQGNDRVQKFSDAGLFLFSFGTSGMGPGNFSSPSGIASDGTFVYVADTQNHRIQVFTTAGAFVTTWGSFGPGPGSFQFPTDVAIDSSGMVYVTDTGNDRIQVFTSLGAFVDEFGATGSGPEQFDSPQGIAITPSDTVAVADFGNSRLQVLSTSGNFLFQVGSISSEERNRSTEQRLDTLNVTYSRELFDGAYMSLDYDLFSSDEKDKDTGEKLVSSLNHDITAQFRFQPYRWMTFTSLYNLELFETEAGDIKTKRDEFAQTYSLSLQPVPKIRLSATYTRDEIDRNIGEDEDSEFMTASLNLFPTNRINLNFGVSNQKNEEGGRKVLETNSFSATSNMKVYRGVDFFLQYSNSQTQDFEADGEVDSQRVRGQLRLIPRHNMTLNTTAEYSMSDSKFAGAPTLSSDTLLSSVDFSWAISRRLDLFVDVDYITTDSSGLARDNLGYLSNLIWRMNDKLTFFLGYRGGTDEDDIVSFRTQAKVPLSWGTRLSANFEVEQGGENDLQYFFVELTKNF